MRSLERNIEKNWVNWFHRKCPDGFAVKLSSEGFRGLPDRMVLAPDGKQFFIEFKGKGGRVRPLQTEIHKRLRAIGFRVYVCRSITAAREACYTEGVIV